MAYLNSENVHILNPDTFRIQVPHQIEWGRERPVDEETRGIRYEFYLNELMTINTRIETLARVIQERKLSDKLKYNACLPPCIKIDTLITDWYEYAVENINEINSIVENLLQYVPQDD